MMTSQELMFWITETYLPDLKIGNLDINHRATSELSDLVLKAAEILSVCEKSNTDPGPDIHTLLSESTKYEDSEDVIREIQLAETGHQLAILCRDNSQIINLQNELKMKLNNTEFSKITFKAGDPPKTLPSWIAAMLFRYKTENLGKETFKKIFKQLAVNDNFRVPRSDNPEALWQMLMKFAHRRDDETSVSMENIRTRLNWPDSLPDDEGMSEDSILITTIHQSKGLEFDRVKLLERSGAMEDTDALEEGRVLFVALSRAKNELTFLEVPENMRFYHRQFNDHNRWHRYARNGINLLEIGQQCDLNLEAILSTDIQGNEETVKDVQIFLAKNEPDLIGREVTLKKTPLPNEERKFVYNVILSYEGRELILGQTTQILTKDILSIMNHGKYKLPFYINGLRIRGINTVARPSLTSAYIPSPWSESRLWLAVDIHGIGLYKSSY